MDPIITTALTTFSAAMAANSFKGAKVPAQALDDILTLVGFEKLHFYAEKKRAKTEVHVKDFKEKIAQELIATPEEQLQEPKLSIVGPAIEASKYYIEEEEFRTAFAKLIGAAMDKSKNSLVHESFVEIIKQLSPLDAQNLKLINQNGNDTPLGEINLKFPDESHRTYYSHIFPLNTKYSGNQYSAPSIQNLNRLGLLSIDYRRFMSTDSMYDFINQTIEYSNVQYEANYRNEQENLLENSCYSVSITKGLGVLTPLGRNFCEICL